MPPLFLLALGGLGAYAAYRFLQRESLHAAGLRAEMNNADMARQSVETLVLDPVTGVYRPVHRPEMH